MSKVNYFTGQPVFTQLLKLIPKHVVQQVVRNNDADRYYKRFKTYEHLVTMLYTCFHSCKSLREVVTGMMACTTKLNHLGIACIPRRSTLAEANANRAEEVFSQLYQRLYQHYYPDSPMLSRLEKRLFIFDSTTISLFSEVMRTSGAKPSGKSKGGVKAHVLMKADEDVPRFVCLTEAKENDNIFPAMLQLPARSIVTFDRIYYGFKPLIHWSETSVTWVTRMHSNVAYTVTKTRTGKGGQQLECILSDEEIIAGNKQRKDKLRARRIVYQDPLSQKVLIFLTNNFRMNALTIANIYKKRWQIECLFKRLKQNYPLKYFLGESENAIKIQIWCALITDLLIKIVKDKVGKRWSFSNIASMIRLHLMTYIDLFKFLHNPEKVLLNYLPPPSDKQCYLFPT